MMPAETNVELMERVSFEAKRDLDSDEDDLFNDEGGVGGDNTDDSFVLPPPFQGKHQLQAMLHRQWLFKVTDRLSPAFQGHRLDIESMNVDSLE